MHFQLINILTWSVVVLWSAIQHLSIALLHTATRMLESACSKIRTERFSASINNFPFIASIISCHCEGLVLLRATIYYNYKCWQDVSCSCTFSIVGPSSLMLLTSEVVKKENLSSFHVYRRNWDYYHYYTKIKAVQKWWSPLCMIMIWLMPVWVSTAFRA